MKPEVPSPDEPQVLFGGAGAAAGQSVQPLPPESRQAAAVPHSQPALSRQNSRVSRTDQDLEVAALMRGTSAIFSSIDDMRIKNPSPGIGHLAVETSQVCGEAVEEVEAMQTSDEGADAVMLLSPALPQPESAEAAATAAEAAAMTEAREADDLRFAMELSQKDEAGAARVRRASSLPQPADIGRRVQVYWADERRWYPGTLTAIEAGHDDGLDAGDYHVRYEDGDEQWEPLGTRTQYKWTSERGATETGAGSKDARPTKQRAKKPPSAQAGVAALPLATTPPGPLDIGRRLVAYWPTDKQWFAGTLTTIEAGHDDGREAGDFHVRYDDGDEQWEPLGTRTSFKWTSERPAASPQGFVSSSSMPSPSQGGDASTQPQASASAAEPPPAAPPLRPPKNKRMLSGKSFLAALPEAKSQSSRDDIDLN